MLTDYIWTFVIGGLICVIGQILMDTTKLTPPRILVIFVVSGVILQAIGIYQPLVDLAGPGATVPLPGFGYALAKGAIEEVASKGLIGALSGGITATATGVGAAIGFGYLVAIIFSPKSKR